MNHCIPGIEGGIDSFNNIILYLISDCEKLLCFRYYDGSTLDYIAQSEPLIIKHPVDKLKKFIKVKKNCKCNGIENDAFQDENLSDKDVLPSKQRSSSLEDLTCRDEQILAGVKKKSSNRLNVEVMGGTKKKIRAKTLNSPCSKEYYQIWNASSSPSPESEGKINFV